jgi:hypothetical protein
MAIERGKRKHAFQSTNWKQEFQGEETTCTRRATKFQSELPPKGKSFAHGRWTEKTRRRKRPLLGKELTDTFNNCKKTVLIGLRGEKWNKARPQISVFQSARNNIFLTNILGRVIVLEMRTQELTDIQ